MSSCRHRGWAEPLGQFLGAEAAQPRQPSSPAPARVLRLPHSLPTVQHRGLGNLSPEPKQPVPGVTGVTDGDFSLLLPLVQAAAASLGQENKFLGFTAGLGSLFHPLVPPLLLPRLAGICRIFSRRWPWGPLALELLPALTPSLEPDPQHDTDEKRFGMQRRACCGLETCFLASS